MYHDASNKFQFKLIWFRGDAFQEFQCLMAAIFSNSGPEVTKLFSCSIQLSMKVILLMLKCHGILKLINTTSERLKAINVFCQHFSFYEQWKFHAYLS